jgi:prevent-host-death family protein
MHGTRRERRDHRTAARPHRPAGFERMCYMWHNRDVRTAGVREARQDLSSLLDDVRKGREVTITDRGRPVARLVPVGPRQPFPDLSAIRKKMRPIDRPLSLAILEEREDRG